MKNKIWLSSPHMGQKEFEFVTEAFNTNWIAPLGPHVDGFEHDIATYLKDNVHVAALTSGTAALHLGLILLGVQRGHEVICQSMTFSASANPITYLGATPVFVDSEADTWNMCPIQLQEAIKDRIAKTGKAPKAIIPVHLYGMPAKMEKINAIAALYGIPVLEDAAEALGSHINGRMCGTMGAIAALSFNGNKIITTSGGGALISPRKDIAEKARFLATQARDTAPHYQHSHIGYNYRLSNVLAGIGRGQMLVLDQRVAARRTHFETYTSRLAHLPGISFLQEPQGYFSNRWLTAILVNPQQSGGITREALRHALDKEYIESRPLWKPMHLQPVFAGAPYYGSGICDRLFENGLCLPSGSNLSAADMERIITAITHVWEKGAGETLIFTLPIYLQRLRVRLRNM